MSKKGKLGLLLMSVVVMALVLSSCFLPQAPKVAPTLSISPTTITAVPGQPFNVVVNASSNSGISQIVATFFASPTVTYTATSNPASFTFMAPNVIAQSYYYLRITATAKNGLSAVSTETVDVSPVTTAGSITYAVQLNNPSPHVYLYPVGPAENGAVIFTVNVYNGASSIGGVSVFVDGSQIPATPVSASSLNLKAKLSSSSTPLIIEKTYGANYYITANHAGPHTYYVVFYGNNGQPIAQSKTGYFYITYPSAQSVTLSAATPLYNAKYINGLTGVSFTAKATDYTSQYEGFLINGTPFATYLNIATAVKVLNAVYPISVPANALTSAGTTTFTFKDVSIGGNAVTANQSYVVVKATPVLRASYKGIQSSGNTLYVGISPTTFQVYAADPFWMTSAATLGTQPFVLTQNGTATVDVSGLSNSATEAFSAKVTNYANLSSSLNLTIVRVTVSPVIHYANIYGLSTYNGVPYSTSGTITVGASVTSPYLSSVTLNLKTDSATPALYSLTKSSTGLWTGTVNTANLLPGTYKAWISAQDLALNVATALTSPATVNVYRSLQNVFTTSLTTIPSTPVNGYVKSATINANINPSWVYAVNKVILYRTGVASETATGTYASSYPFTIKASGTYTVVVVTNVNQNATQTEAPWVVKIDNSLPSLKLLPATQTAYASSVSIMAKGTDNYSGIANLTLSYQTLGGTGIDNGGWVTIGSANFANTQTAVSTFVWKNLNTLPDGKYNIQLVGTSGVGNTNTVTGYVINDYAGAPQVVWTPSATLVFTNKATYNVSFTVLNESDITATITYKQNTSSATTSRFVSTSYTAYPLTEATTLKFSPQASYTYKATVTDMARNVATNTTIFVYDTTSPTATLTAGTGAIFSYGKYVAAAGTPVTFTISATDNLSGIKSIKVNGVSALLQSGSKKGAFGQILHGTYVATLTSPANGGPWSVTIVATDNAQNRTSETLAITVDNAAPTINVSFYNVGGGKLTPFNNGYVYSKAAPTVAATVYGYELTKYATYIVNSGTATPIHGWSNLITQAGSYLSVKATVTSGEKYSITIKATDGINKLSNSNTTSATIVFGSSTPTVSVTLQTNQATIPYMLNGYNMDHYINLASSNTSYNATIVVKDPNSIPIQNAAFYINGTAYPFISNGQATRTYSQQIYSPQNGGITTATLTVNLNQTPYVSRTGLYSLTVVATDYALNTSTTAATYFYYDVTKPVLQPNTTLYKSGNYYYFDLGFNKQMATLTNKSIAASIVTFQFANGLTYTSDPASQYFVPVTSGNSGLLHIWGLKTTAGSPVNVLPLAGNTVTITVGASYVSAGGNPVAGPVTVTFTNVSAPKPVNP